MEQKPKQTEEDTTYVTEDLNLNETETASIKGGESKEVIMWLRLPRAMKDAT